MREKITQTLVNEFKKHDFVLGCYEAGSAAFGRADEWSDIDFQIVVKDDFVEQAVSILENTLQSIAPIEDRYILPAPTWHGHWQGFYQLQGVSPYLVMDALVMKESSPSYFTEAELHGTPVIYFDKTGRIGNEHINKEDLAAVIPQRIKRAENVSRMFRLIVDKEVNRNRLMDAFEMYYNLLFRTMVELLRIKYDTARWSFGPRYLSHDLPVEIYDKISNLTFISNTADLLHKKDVVLEQINRLLAELKRTYQV